MVDKILKVNCLPYLKIKMILCEYDCGQEAKFELKNGRKICSKSSACCPKIRALNSEAKKKYYSNGGKRTGFTDKEKHSEYYKLSRESLVKNLKLRPFEFWGRGLKKFQILKEQDGCCLKCKLSEWQGIGITFELDHIDGNNKNDKRENLRLLCPNCHSQTPTWRKRKLKLKK